MSTPNPAPDNQGAGAQPSAAEPALLDHEYDGIKEYDNPMPRWWTSTFWATVVFSLGYLLVYHVSGRVRSVQGEYAEQVRVASEIEAKRALADTVSESSLSKLMADATTIGEAKLIFETSCQACHGEEGRGLIGPNLTDDYWVHGKGMLMDIHGVVRSGVITKGMPAWDRQLTPIQLRKVVAYVGTLRGKHLAGKPPEGTKISNGESTALPSSADSRAATLTKP
jgi:cytochrome c oxidase cbb3-type subunit 3